MQAATLKYTSWRGDSCRGQVCAEIPPQELVAWARGNWPAQSELLKAEPRRQTRRLEWNGRQLLVKSFAPRAFRPDRAAAVHKKTLRLQALGINVPPSLGFCACADASIHVAEWLADAVPLLSFAGREGLEQRLLPALDDLMQQLARLHLGGLVHGDLKWGNVLLRGDDCWLVDLDSVSRARPGKRGARDLARFAVDCEEAGAGADFVRQVKEVYARTRGWDLPRVERWIAADYRKISERHRRRYGENHRL